MAAVVQVNASDELKLLLDIEDELLGIIGQADAPPSPRLQALLDRVREQREALEDVLDAEEARMAQAEAKSVGTITWREFEAELDRA